MAQINWIFLDDNGGRHRVGLYHGDRSGHLMIHCNMRVVQIDFSVHDSKTYSFFIEDEFIEIIVEKMKTGGFGYEFKINKTVDTPKNRVRRIENKQNLTKLWIFIAGFVVIIAAVFFGLRWRANREDQRESAATAIVHNVNKSNAQVLSAAGMNAVGALHLETLNGKQVGIYTFKTADSVEIRGTFQVKQIEPVVLPNGFPLTAGDAFEVVYLPTDPQVHRLKFYQPARTTVETYIKLALAKEIELHPEFSTDKNLCRILTLAEIDNWTALADVIHQQKSPEENPKHNRETYRKQISRPMIEAKCKD
ncbi:MAG: hypothetical protein JNJ57_10905 [Saprospiraceae bacterium]|nr:hypothetical protein [Saprospiraceae bacterium]